jgi:hypothetical protein
MNPTLRLSSLVLSVGLLAGCGASGGFLRDSISSQRFDYRMDISGVRYVKSVSGSSSTGSILCVIPLATDLYESAMLDLHASAKLEPNQVLVNLREDYAIRSYVGIYCNRRLLISGDVFELTPAGATHGASAPRASVSVP